MIGIKSYDINIPFASFSVYPLAELGKIDTPIREEQKKYPLLLSPSLKADIAVSLPGESISDGLFGRLAAIAAAKFMSSVRGLPVDGLEVECGEEIYRIAVSGVDGKFGIMLPKCKELLSNSKVFTAGVFLLCSEYSVEELRIRLVGCADTRTLSGESLKALLLPEQGRSFDIVVGCSEGDPARLVLSGAKELDARCALAASIAVAHRRRGRVGETLRVSCECGEAELLFSEEGLLLLCG